MPTEIIVAMITGGLALLGVVNDPTTQGVGDSRQALDYDRPKLDRKLQNGI